VRFSLSLEGGNPQLPQQLWQLCSNSGNSAATIEMLVIKRNAVKRNKNQIEAYFTTN